MFDDSRTGVSGGDVFSSAHAVIARAKRLSPPPRHARTRLGALLLTFLLLVSCRDATKDPTATSASPSSATVAVSLETSPPASSADPLRVGAAPSKLRTSAQDLIGTVGTSDSAAIDPVAVTPQFATDDEVALAFGAPASGWTSGPSAHPGSPIIGPYQRRLVGLQLTSPVSELEVGDAVDVAVTARFSDGSLETVTHQCYWITTDSTVAHVYFSKFLIGTGPGTADISASWGGMTSNAVTIDVLAPPPPPPPPAVATGRLAVGAPSLEFTSPSASATITLENLGDTPLRWRISSTVDWIRAPEFAGQLAPFETRNVTLVVDGTGLGAGDHPGLVTVCELHDPGTTAVFHARLRLGGGTPLAPTTYYVDFVGGSDTNDGLTPATAFKRCPWDLQATGVSASTTLTPGSEVIFKGGIDHPVQLEAFSSGQAGAPIVLDGNTRGTFGDGPAVLNGSQPITGWTAIGGGLYQASIPAAASDVFGINLYAGEQLLTLSQGPGTPIDAYQYDDLTHFESVPPSQATTTSITDPGVLSGLPADFWVGGYMAIWAPSNRVYIRPLTGYSPSDARVTFQSVSSVYPDRDTYYSILNCTAFLDSPGEFVVDEANDTVILRPLPGVDLNDTTASVRRIGVDLQGKDHIEIRGFRMLKYAAGIDLWHNGLAVRNTQSAGGGSSYIHVHSNEVAFNRCMEKTGGITLNYTDHCTVRGNVVHHNFRNRGLLAIFSDELTLEDNVLISNGSTGIGLFETPDSAVIGNELLLHFGVHANGITAYSSSHRCEIVGNTVLEGRIALTTQDSNDLVISRNTLGVHPDFDGYTVADWGVSLNLLYHHNIIANPLAKGIFLNAGSFVGTELRNCIIEGSLIPPGAITSTHNIYPAISWMQDDEPLGPAEFEATLADLFMGAEWGDYTPRPDSPAIDQGVDLGEGYSGAGPDIGPIEVGP